MQLAGGDFLCSKPPILHGFVHCRLHGSPPGHRLSSTVSPAACRPYSRMTDKLCFVPLSSSPSNLFWYLPILFTYHRAEHTVVLLSGTILEVT